VDWDGPQEGRFLVQNVHEGLDGIEPGSVKRLRIVGMPVKTQPNMNSPSIGVTNDDPGKCVLGTVPVEKDGSAYFRVPSGVPVFFQALDEQGRAIQTMRSLTYVQPGQTQSCIGCHEGRSRTPPVSGPALAASRDPSKLRLDPEGSWPLRFDKLVQPVLDKHCVSCHRADGKDPKAGRFDLTAEKSYANLVSYGKPSLRDHVKDAYRAGRSVAGAGASRTSALLARLQDPKSPRGVRLDEDSFRRLVTWMDTYAQKQGSFSPQQEEQLRRFRQDVADLLEP
jgi:mono/diheme cytochrome c family protein